ncbi:translin-associated factor X-interacting protein 1 isoform X2 [Alosa sapidissima]|uniref:translin-associated factor X-interacting protein 1 isoform X2 n=1 Tax=Alosa sapidissima TaxID=34773 RepID=UPI001C09D373|nr:translin-associated factor X-interacting protein 1 isoform X2 [Alosa sapidissima]
MSIPVETRLPPLILSKRQRSPTMHPHDYGRDYVPIQQSNAHGYLTVLRKLRDGGANGFLSTWPAHVTSQTVHPRRRSFNTKDIKNHGSEKCFGRCSDEFSGQVGKPRFLMQLEDYLKRELQTLDLQQPKVQERRLQTYREVFDCFIEDFKTYKPLLTAIKNEYEATLAYMRDQIRELEPLRTQLVLVSEQCERRILALREEERAEMKAMKENKKRLHRIIEDMREKQSALEAQVCRLQKDLAAQYLAYRDEYDARKLLIANISSMSYATEEEADDDMQVAESEDPVKLKLALKVCREDLTKAQVELNRLRAEYGDVVPRRDWESLDRCHQENVQKLETLQTDFDQMKTEYNTLLEVHKQVLLERDSFQAELEVFQGSSTPRPDWECCADILGGSERWKELFEGQSSQQRLMVLLENLAEKASKEFFQGRGTGSDVPVFLHYEGQLKNVRLKKADVVRIIKEVMKEKDAADEELGMCSDLPEFLHKYLERQHGDHAGDWAYSLMETIHRHLKDELISLFNDILSGEVDESLYHGQIHLVTHLLKMVVQSDTAESGILSVSEFREALRKAFPLKNENDLGELVNTAQAELDNTEGSLVYQKLFIEDSDGKNRGFLSLLKKQATAERHHYINQLKTQLEGKREVDVAELRTGFKAIDPSIDSKALDNHVCFAFMAKIENLNQAQPIDTEIALQRLLAADVNRVGPPPSHLN